MSAQDVIEKTQALILETVPKVKNAPKFPTDKSIAAPTTMIYADNIDFLAISGGFVQTIFDMKINFMVPRKSLNDSMAWLSDVPKAIGDIFRADPSIGGTCQTYNGDVNARFARETRDGLELIGYVITVPRIKMNE